jgi:hypothetical protein
MAADNDWSTPKALAIPKEGYFTPQQGQKTGEKHMDLKQAAISIAMIVFVLSSMLGISRRVLSVALPAVQVFYTHNEAINAIDSRPPIPCGFLPRFVAVRINVAILSGVSATRGAFAWHKERGGHGTVRLDRITT